MISGYSKGSNVKGEAVAEIAGMKVMLSLAEKEDGDGMYLAPENRIGVW